MSRNSLIIASGIAIAGIAIGVGLVSRTPPPESAAIQEKSDTTAQDIGAVRDEISALKNMISSASSDGQTVDPQILSLTQDIAALKEQLAALGDKVDTSASPTLTPQAQPAPSEEEQRAQAEKAVAERMNYIASQFEHEDVDPQWGTNVQTQLISTLQNPALHGSTLVNAECRSTLCRLEVTHEKGADLTEFQSVLADETAKIAPEGAIQQVAGADGTMRSIIYLARSGSHMPSPKSP